MRNLSWTCNVILTATMSFNFQEFFHYKLLAFGSGRLRCRCCDGTTFNQIKNLHEFTWIYMEFCCWTLGEIFLLACLVTFIWKPFACCKSAKWIQMVPTLSWKLYEEAVCYLVPEGDGTYLDLGRATVNRQMQPENSSCQRDLYEVLPRHSIVCTGLQCSSQLQVLWRDHLQSNQKISHHSDCCGGFTGTRTWPS